MRHLREHFDVLIVDESTKFKNTSTARFKRMRKFIPLFKRRYILTGSFTPQGLLDLFGQIYILDEGGALGRYITQFKNKYFRATDYMGYNLAPVPGAAEEIADKIKPLTLVVDYKDNLVMPELLFNDIVVDLPPAALRKHTEMFKELVTQAQEGLIVAANAAVATSKCRQIANGFVFNNFSEWEDLHDAKIEALQDLVEQLSGAPVLVLYEFIPDLEKLRKAFPKAVVLTGSGSADKDARNIQLFSAGVVQMALGQFRSVSLGIDGLQNNCNTIVMYGLTWSLEAYSQSIDRVWRSGQKQDSVIVHRLIAAGTVDERVLTVLNDREADQSAFLNLLQ